MSEQTIECTTYALEAELMDDKSIDVFCWRMEQLQKAGYAPALADAFASDFDVDLHFACDLVGAGCPPTIAYRIVS